MDQECDAILEKLLGDKSCYDLNEISNDTHWKYFREEEMEREFWLALFQKAIRQSLHTLKFFLQNAEERPLAAMSEEIEKSQAVQAEEKKYTAGQQGADSGKNDKPGNDSDNVLGSKVDIGQRTFERYRLHVENRGDQQGNKAEKSKGPSITVVGSNGRMKRFENLDDYEKNGLDKRVDNIVQMRTNRNQVFKDANPWTYTAEEAAQLGLLPEIPKDYDQKSKDKKMRSYQQTHYGHRCPHQAADDDADDGSQLKMGEIEYRMRGEIKTFTMEDMPKEEEEKDHADMTEEEYENWIRETRGWENWKDDHERGIGNPYFR
ncbi:hypothetical protein RFI_14006 [Reticulomyxa filosa]|uniref:Uncharacterized protein n=1 Tax=Reticulomyxa filosa TaxID=46433 RepID=X6NA55_RETFI|nr:hypothetical protein RFI_14006 [Reticulomyxa filosa]|eukprot:ETO23180.1 hypothetical protein RFI_14006 [Reticulomyxa filosa]